MHKVKFIKPLNLFIRIIFLLLILIKSRSVVVLIYAYLNYADEYIPVAVTMAGGTLSEAILLFILCIAGFISTFGISRFSEWGRITLVCVFSLFILFNLYVVFSFFNLQIRYDLNSPVVDLSNIYLKLTWYLSLCCVSGAIIYFFTKADVRKVFKGE